MTVVVSVTTAMLPRLPVAVMTVLSTVPLISPSDVSMVTVTRALLPKAGRMAVVVGMTVTSYHSDEWPTSVKDWAALVSLTSVCV